MGTINHLTKSAVTPENKVSAGAKPSVGREGYAPAAYETPGPKGEGISFIPGQEVVNTNKATGKVLAGINRTKN